MSRGPRSLTADAERQPDDREYWIRVTMSTETIYQQPGSLPRPGVIGRAVRLAFGVACLYLVISIIRVGPVRIADQFPNISWLWGWAIAAFYVFSYVINIGFTRSWGRKPQIVLIGVAAAVSVASMLLNGEPFATPLGWFVVVWLLYVYGHLALSFVLAAVLATPGCEMRAPPHLWAIIKRRETREHHCPAGPLHSIDAWERSWKKRAS